MPSRPARLCPRCQAIRRGDSCSCGWSRSGWSDKRRGSRHQRGYDNRWVKLRRRKLSVDPLCAICLEADRATEATEAHHVQPFVGIHDPLRLARSNLQSLCSSCHRTVTARR